MDAVMSHYTPIVLIGGAVLAYVGLPALVHNNVNPIVGGICSLATPNAWERMKCEIEAQQPAQQPITTYTFGPGVKCSWMDAGRYFPLNPSTFKTSADGAYILQNNDSTRITVAGNGSASLTGADGGVIHSGNCVRVGGL
jgi:hypothetical protein